MREIRPSCLPSVILCNSVTQVSLMFDCTENVWDDPPWNWGRHDTLACSGSVQSATTLVGGSGGPVTRKRERNEKKIEVSESGWEAKLRTFCSFLYDTAPRRWHIYLGLILRWTNDIFYIKLSVPRYRIWTPQNQEAQKATYRAPEYNVQPFDRSARAAI